MILPCPAATVRAKVSRSTRPGSSRAGSIAGLTYVVSRPSRAIFADKSSGSTESGPSEARTTRPAPGTTTGRGGKTSSKVQTIEDKAPEPTTYAVPEGYREQMELPVRGLAAPSK